MSDKKSKISSVKAESPLLDNILAVMQEQRQKSVGTKQTAKKVAETHVGQVEAQVDNWAKNRKNYFEVVRDLISFVKATNLNYAKDSPQRGLGLDVEGAIRKAGEEGMKNLIHAYEEYRGALVRLITSWAMEADANVGVTPVESEAKKLRNQLADQMILAVKKQDKAAVAKIMEEMAKLPD